jgi:hypothetical protein
LTSIFQTSYHDLLSLTAPTIWYSSATYTYGNWVISSEDAIGRQTNR